MGKGKASNGDGMRPRQRKDGLWEARITTGRNPLTGAYTRKSKYFKTEKEAAQWLRKAAHEVDKGTYITDSKTTVAAWLDVWTAEYLQDKKLGTIEKYNSDIRNHIKPGVGHVQLQKLTPHAVQCFINDLTRKKGLAPKTVKSIHGCLHSAIEQAYRNGMIVKNPADNPTLPRIEKRDTKTIPEDKIGEFVERVKDTEYGLLYIVLLFTGMRRGEIMGLTWDCVDFQAGRVIVRRQLLKGKAAGSKYEMQSLKNDKPRTIVPAQLVMQCLWKRKKQEAAEKQAAGAAWDNPLNLVFTNPLGQHLKQDTIYNHYKRIVADMGLQDLRIHDLRHSFAVNALRSGDDIKTVQETLGHHTAAFTLDVYGHVTDAMRRDSAARMDAFVSMYVEQQKQA